jgi:hypothetical protein
MENYTKQEKAKEELQPNEVRVTKKGNKSKNFQYALTIIQNPDNKTITINATNDAIPNAIYLIESIKREIGGLYQINSIISKAIVELYIPKIEGLNEISQSRTLTLFSTTLSKDPLDENNLGF